MLSVSMRIILVNLVAGLMAMCAPIGLLLIAYVIVPINLTITVMGVITGLAAIVVVVGGLVMSAIFIYALVHAKMFKVEETITPIPDDVRPITDVLRTLKFKKIGDVKSYKELSNDLKHSYMLLHPSRAIIAQVGNVDQEDPVTIEFSTHWGNEKMIVTSYPKADETRAKHLIMQSTDVSPEDAYRLHVQAIKEFVQVAGQPTRFDSMQQIIAHDDLIKCRARFVLPFVTEAAFEIVTAFIGVFPPLMGFAAFIIEGALLFGLVESPYPFAYGVLFIVMTAFVFGTPKVFKLLGWSKEDDDTKIKEKPKVLAET